MWSACGFSHVRRWRAPGGKPRSVARRVVVKLTEFRTTSGVVPAAAVCDGDYQSSDLQGGSNPHNPRCLV